ncbi:hypothetical protein SLEP1_g44204 [Rubroshorea leprosula]|uniref:Uncharacterized protein n=1 Tax=Rubroshorea leprosula TaxID=152421 RepID=A0AAV5LFG9_9ROSI|nr:hypothetical protein SLEP1_g44204 [Rubroshorea leprosula]
MTLAVGKIYRRYRYFVRTDPIVPSKDCPPPDPSHYFHLGVDAAFEAEDDKAYLFKGNQYNYINYEERTSITSGTITEKFSCLKDTKFEGRIEAAFASHKKGEAYLYKGDLCALINFDNNCLVEVDTIGNKWPNFGSLVPRKNMTCT